MDQRVQKGEGDEGDGSEGAAGVLLSLAVYRLRALLLLSWVLFSTVLQGHPPLLLSTPQVLFVAPESCCVPPELFPFSPRPLETWL